MITFAVLFQVNENFSQALISEVPPIKVNQRIVSCDGGEYSSYICLFANDPIEIVVTFTEHRLILFVLQNRGSVRHTCLWNTENLLPVLCTLLFTSFAHNSVHAHRVSGVLRITAYASSDR